MAGLRYDEIEAGQRFTSAGRTPTETDHALFMMLVGDWHAIHADEEYARRTAAGRRLMHASLGLSLAMGLQAQAMAFADPMIGAIGLTDWRFRTPMFIGDTVHVEIEILRKRITSDRARYIVERTLRLARHDGVVLQDGTAAVMLRLPPGAGTASLPSDHAPPPGAQR
ncbi:MaoC/PaaZ C-terminal domain-containing protein [Bosea minatitlanensis]|jgi:acyl dehydratase|uniref:MaoC/PaaZ C-terminal domain-containing protein n=1 Tax=Bosea minatitlanensis TaxID=128782 RepID=A0ABW0F403_9HYPH|nr:MaoC/PaaZ C-terminal domain-containing protein [Bosea minatitlanensis]MCT4493972.1 MaoC/PaaZ C-terminal domain-containing protein [Bosea minatitlanensis]